MYDIGVNIVDDRIYLNSQPYKYSGKELDTSHGLNLYDFSARHYDGTVPRFTTMDPLSEKYYSISPYAYCNNNPLRFVDPDGKEPIKSLVGTSTMFKSVLDNSPSKVGSYKGENAKAYMLKLGSTEFKLKQMRPLPTQTGFYNQKKGRYIYTKKGGWVDMVHFLFYAGKAYEYKQDGKTNPIGEAVQDGYMQERTDEYAASHSAFSYEDLPSDYFGADCAVNHFDPDSDQSFGEQLINYLNNILEATDPENAPNYNDLPTDEPTKPTRTNKTTKPVYTEDNP